MVSHLFFYQFALIALLWLFFLLLYAWPSDRTQRPNPAAPLAPRRQRSTEPTPFAGLTQKPHCAQCEQDAIHPVSPLPTLPQSRPSILRRPRTVDTSTYDLESISVRNS
jgi:hypothetical protein